MKRIKNISISFLGVAMMIAIFISGCQKNEIKEQPAAVSGIDPDGLYMLGSGDGTSAYERLDIDLAQLQNEVGVEPSLKSGNAHTHGHYSTQPNNSGFFRTNEFNFTTNSQGTSGVWHIWGPMGQGGDNSYQIILDADCLDSDGESAVLTGTVTQVIGEAPPFFTIGSRWWMKVKDNGQGPNSPKDQYFSLMVFNPSGTTPCNAFNLSSFIWTIPPPIGGLRDVQYDSDQIMVN